MGPYVVGASTTNQEALRPSRNATSVNLHHGPRSKVITTHSPFNGCRNWRLVGIQVLKLVSGAERRGASLRSFWGLLSSLTGGGCTRPDAAVHHPPRRPPQPRSPGPLRKTHPGERPGSPHRPPSRPSHFRHDSAPAPTATWDEARRGTLLGAPGSHQTAGFPRHGRSRAPPASPPLGAGGSQWATGHRCSQPIGRHQAPQGKRAESPSQVPCQTPGATEELVA